MRSAKKLIVGNPKRKRLIGRAGRRCEYNIEVDLVKMRWERELYSCGSD
jgi:hypothetical protein